MRFVRLALAVLLFAAGLAFVALCPRRVRLEMVSESCFVARGHPAFPEKTRVVDCRLELQSELLLVRGPETVVFLGPRPDMASELARVRKGEDVVWSSVDAFDLGLAGVLFLAGIAMIRGARASDPDTAYVEELVQAFPGGRER
ncbi:MAG: hypothetical protein ACXVEF_37490 [Polyangiales bacterium]